MSKPSTKLLPFSASDTQHLLYVSVRFLYLCWRTQLDSLMKSTKKYIKSLMLGKSPCQNYAFNGQISLDWQASNHSGLTLAIPTISLSYILFLSNSLVPLRIFQQLVSSPSSSCPPRLDAVCFVSPVIHFVIPFLIEHLAGNLDASDTPGRVGPPNLF